MYTERKPTHPGVILLEDVITPLGLSITEAANYLGVTRKALSEFVNCKSSLSIEMALKLGIATKTTPQSWLNMQQNLDLWEIKHEKNITNVKEFPRLKELVGL